MLHLFIRKTPPGNELVHIGAFDVRKAVFFDTFKSNVPVLAANEQRR
jgi:hypothetical protein